MREAGEDKDIKTKMKDISLEFNQNDFFIIEFVELWCDFSRGEEKTIV